jgi:hypothetical protein
LIPAIFLARGASGLMKVLNEADDEIEANLESTDIDRKHLA